MNALIPVLIILAVLVALGKLSVFLVDVLSDVINRTTYMPEQVKLARGGLAILLLGSVAGLTTFLVHYLFTL